MNTVLCYDVDMAQKRVSTAPVRRLAEERGIDNPYKLARMAGISYPTARKWWYDEGMEAIVAESLIALVELLKVEPGELFEIVS